MLAGTFYDGGYHYFAQYEGGISWTVKKYAEGGHESPAIARVTLGDELGRPTFEPATVIAAAIEADHWKESDTPDNG